MRPESSDSPPRPGLLWRDGLLALGVSAELPQAGSQDGTKGGSWGPAAGLLLLQSCAPFYAAQWDKCTVGPHSQASGPSCVLTHLRAQLSS